MKKYLKIILPIFILGAIICMSYMVLTKIIAKSEKAEHIKTIPSFSYLTVDGKVFSNTDLKKNTPVIFIYFNSECEYCQIEAIRVGENKDKLKEAQLLFVSIEDPQKIKNFATQFQLIKETNMIFLFDKQAGFAATFDIQSPPAAIIYDSNHTLIDKIKGQAKIETILEKLKANKP